MSYYEGLAFFLCLIGVLLIAAVLGYLEKPLKWFSFVVSLLFVAGVFWGSWLNFLYLVLFYVWSLVLILGYFSIRQKGGRKGRHLPCLCTALTCAACDLQGVSAASYEPVRIHRYFVSDVPGCADDHRDL